MVTEIELKAHVENSEALKILLEEKAEYLYAFEKEDDYFFLDGAQGQFPSGVRVRSEKRTFSDGTEKTAAFVTYKTKEVRDGIEINHEREFEINSPSCCASMEFKEFLIKAGFKPGISKKKNGWAFFNEGLTAELAEVEKLGWFLELEILTGEADAGHLNAAGCSGGNKTEENFLEKKGRLLGFLDSLGLKKESIESRFYSQMLSDFAS